MLDSLGVLFLGKRPHQFYRSRLHGHAVCFNNTISFFDLLTYLIYRHVAPFVGNLRHHNDGFPSGKPFIKGMSKGAVPASGQAAHAKRLKNNGLILIHKIMEYTGIHAGNQGEQQNSGFQSMIKCGSVPRLV